MKRIAIFGAGHLGLQLAHHLRAEGSRFVGFYDDTMTVGAIAGTDYEVLGSKNDLITRNKIEFDELLLGVGYKNMEARRNIFSELKSRSIDFYTFVHRSAIVDPSANIDEGAVIYPGCIIDMRCSIGKNVLLNNGVIVSHDSSIGSHSFVAPGVNIAGFVSIGDLNFLGIGSTIRDNIRTTSDVKIAAGSLLIRSLDQEGVYRGNPIK